MIKVGGCITLFHWSFIIVQETMVTFVWKSMVVVVLQGSWQFLYQ